MTKPNLFILGAPKCGTTSIASWLGAHPDVFMSPVKEPCHFNTDSRYVITASRRNYERLFAEARPEHKCVGEASAWYLYSANAVENIEEYSAGARYIVMLRNPIDLVVSLHSQQVVSGEENELSFERAWRLQGCRANGTKVSRLCREPQNLVYGEVAKLGAQVERLLATVPESRVKLVLFDDLIQYPSDTYRSVLAFLGLSDDGRRDFSAENPRKQLRSVTLNKLMKSLSDNIRKVTEGGTGVGKLINSLNAVQVARSEISPELRSEIADYFHEDVALLSRILRRNLDHWQIGTAA